MKQNQTLLYLGLSLALHVVLTVVFVGIIPLHSAPLPPKITPHSIIVSMRPAPKPNKPVVPMQNRRFVDSAESVATEESDHNALFESDANTKASSLNAGREAGVPMPTQKGRDANDLVLHDSAFTPTRPAKAATPTLPNERQNQATQQVKAQTPTPAQQNLPQGDHIHLPDARQTASEEKESRETQTVSQTSAQSMPAGPPPSFVADRRHSTIMGNAPLGDTASIASQETELGRYKTKLYRAIGSRWYLYVQNQMALLSVGRIRIRFYIRADGHIDKPEISEGDSKSILAAISLRSVRDVGSLEPFSMQMKEQLGDGYWEEITFSIY